MSARGERGERDYPDLLAADGLHQRSDNGDADRAARGDNGSFLPVADNLEADLRASWTFDQLRGLLRRQALQRAPVGFDNLIADLDARLFCRRVFVDRTNNQPTLAAFNGNADPGKAAGLRLLELLVLSWREIGREAVVQFLDGAGDSSIRELTWWQLAVVAVVDLVERLVDNDFVIAANQRPAEWLGNQVTVAAADPNSHNQSEDHGNERAEGEDNDQQGYGYAA